MSSVDSFGELRNHPWADTSQSLLSCRDIAYCSNQSNSSSVTLESLTKTMNEMRAKFPPKPPIMIVGSLLAKEWFESFAINGTIRRTYDCPVYFCPTELEALGYALARQSEGNEVWLIKDSGEMYHYLPEKQQPNLFMMSEGQWKPIGTAKRIEIQVDGLSRNQLKRQQKRLELIERYATKRTWKHAYDGDKTAECQMKHRLMRRWGIAIPPVQIRSSVDFDMLFEPRMLTSLCVW